LESKLDISTLYYPVLSTAVLIAFIFFSKYSDNRFILFLRPYLQIPYYGIIFTSFQKFLHIINPVDWDWLLLKADYLIIGTDLSVWFQRIAGNTLTEILTISYFSYYFLPTLISVVIFFGKGSDEKITLFREYILALITGWYLAFVFYAVLPAAGPDIAFSEHYTVKLTGISVFTNYYLETLSSYLITDKVRNTFPSMHLSIIMIVNYYAYKRRRVFFVCCTLPFGLGLAVATLYLRQHYFVDLIGSLPMAVFSVYLAKKFIEKNQGNIT
jgi:membrane-associated phospholipid phosphatase